MWLTVAGVTLIIYSLINLYEIQKMPEKIAAALQEGGKQPNNPLMSLLGCFWGIWFIMGNVYFFFYTPETTFDNGPKTNSSSTVSDAHATSCATLEAFGFTFLICLWVVPCVLAICIQTMAAQAMMSHMAGPTAPVKKSPFMAGVGEVRKKKEWSPGTLARDL
jgi:hypothetical protein